MTTRRDLTAIRFYILSLVAFFPPLPSRVGYLGDTGRGAWVREVFDVIET
jgi:hypothetical protein